MWKYPQILKKCALTLEAEKKEFFSLHTYICIETSMEWVNMHTIALHATYHYENREYAYNNVSNDQA